MKKVNEFKYCDNWWLRLTELDIKHLISNSKSIKFNKEKFDSGVDSNYDMPYIRVRNNSGKPECDVLTHYCDCECLICGQKPIKYVNQLFVRDFEGRYEGVCQKCANEHDIHGYLLDNMLVNLIKAVSKTRSNDENISGKSKKTLYGV